MATLSEYWQAIATALDDLGVYTITGSTSTTVSASSLADTTPNASENAYDGRWVFSAVATKQSRRVETGGYTPATGTLTLTLSVMPFTVGTTFALTGLFPVFARHVNAATVEDTDYYTLVNRALAKLLCDDRVTVPITTADTYTLPYDWLDRAERLVRVREPSPVAGRRPVDATWRGWRLVNSGEANLLEVDAPFASDTGVLTLDVLRPADTLVNGAESTLGMTAETDTAIPTVEEVRTVGMMEACEVLMHRSKGRPNGNWLDEFTFWRGEARKLARYDRSIERAEPIQQPQAAAAGAA